MRLGVGGNAQACMEGGGGGEGRDITLTILEYFVF